MFDGSTSYDNSLIVNYNWSFGDGSYLDGIEQNPSHLYTQPGIYTVTLTVTDMGDNTDVDEIIVIVLDY